MTGRDLLDNEGENRTVVIIGGIGYVENIRYISSKVLIPMPVLPTADYIEPPRLDNLAALRRGVLAREKQSRKAISAKGRRRR